jgi:hypothetical protein
MASRRFPLDQPGGLANEGVPPDRGDTRIHLTLPGDRPEIYQIAGYEFTGRDLLPCAVTERTGVGRELLFLKKFNGVLGLSLLEKPDYCVGHEEKENDGKILPVRNDCREDCSDLDHPWDRTPEIGQEFEQRIFLLFRDIIETILFPKSMTPSLVSPVLDP